jgi:hypothetical protein
MGGYEHLFLSGKFRGTEYHLLNLQPHRGAPTGNNTRFCQQRRPPAGRVDSRTGQRRLGTRKSRPALAKVWTNTRPTAAKFRCLAASVRWAGASNEYSVAGYRRFAANAGKVGAANENCAARMK